MKQGHDGQPMLMSDPALLSGAQSLIDLIYYAASMDSDWPVPIGNLRDFCEAVLVRGEFPTEAAEDLKLPPNPDW